MAEELEVRHVHIGRSRQGGKSSLSERIAEYWESGKGRQDMAEGFMSYYGVDPNRTPPEPEYPENALPEGDPFWRDNEVAEGEIVE